MESRRDAALAAGIELAEEALKTADEALQQRQETVSELAAEQAQADTESKQPELALEKARWQLTLAEQNQRLRQLELDNEQLAKSVHQLHLDLLRSQVKFLQTHAAFGADELKEQLRRIDKEQFALNRQVARAKSQLSTVKTLLEQSRKNYTPTPALKRTATPCNCNTRR
nr:hypothetical protein [Methylomarinum sp. Ch1-1]MDP4522790.1 hypothetical protein [Methylomarinum sp. Ch1-1]